MQLSMKESILRAVFCAAVVYCASARFFDRGVWADQIPSGWAADNVRPIGYSDLDGRGGAFKMAIRQVNGRWYLYLGHLWHRGWSIVEVTDPANPKYVKFISGPPNTWTIQMDLHANTMITALQNFAPAWGGDPEKPFEEGFLVWDLSDPLNPKQLSHWKTGSTGTHRDGYPGGKYVNAAANLPGYKGQILVFIDISDPQNPKEAGRWWMPGQKQGEPAPPQNISFHGPAIVDGNTAYLGYGYSIVILDVSDISKPNLVGQLDLNAFKGVHDVLPIPGRHLLFANSEGISETCDEPLNHASLIDIQDPKKPRLISLFPVPVPPKGAPYTDFCDKGGRFGPHKTNLEYHLPDVQKQGDLVYLTYFNAGLRIYDIRDAHLPREVGWFIPPTPVKRLGPQPVTKLVTQTEDVLVDARGNTYITDKQWGLFILRYSGKSQPEAAAR